MLSPSTQKWNNRAGWLRPTQCLEIKIKFQLEANHPLSNSWSDNILINMKSYYDPSKKHPAFGLSDFCSVEIQPKERPKSSKVKLTVFSRDLRPSNYLVVRTYLEREDVTDIIHNASSCEDKTSLLLTIIKTGLDANSTLRLKVVHITEPLWINCSLSL